MWGKHNSVHDKLYPSFLTLTICDTVIYKNLYFVIVHSCWLIAPKTLGISLVIKAKAMGTFFVIIFCLLSSVPEIDTEP